MSSLSPEFQLIGRKGLPLNEALKYAVQIADALAAAHAAGIAHRDVKPANVMVNEKRVVKVLDFGLAKLAQTDQDREFNTTQTVAPLTEEGTIVGTVSYMSPEQVEGKRVDARSDIFSFGLFTDQGIYFIPAGGQPAVQFLRLATGKIEPILRIEKRIAAGMSISLTDVPSCSPYSSKAAPT